MKFFPLQILHMGRFMAAGGLVGGLRRPGWWLVGMLVQFSGAAGSAVLAGVFGWAVVFLCDGAMWEGGVIFYFSGIFC